jgi:riboflavin synthase
MFSGIIETQGRVRRNSGGRITVVCERPLRLRVGDSVAVNGCCLTVVDVDVGEFTADVMPETALRTTLGALSSDDPVNLEPALRAGDPIGGHLVTGHVDATGTVSELRDDANARRVTVDAPAQLLDLVAPKGSVAIDGISLTVTHVCQNSFSVSLIPHTMSVTNAGGWRNGSRVNLEADLIARYVRRLLWAGDAWSRRLPDEGRPSATMQTAREADRGGASEQATMRRRSTAGMT